MMKRCTVCLVLAILLAAGRSDAAKVTNIELSHQKNTTVARIDIDGQVRFTHKTEEPKDGKPYRVIVDVLAATHGLGAKSFSELPPCAIKMIRTSQFAVSPEKIVRVVFDMDRPPLYRIESDTKSILIYFTDKSVPAFAPWTSSEHLTSTAPEQKQAAPVPEGDEPTPKVAVKSPTHIEPGAAQSKDAGGTTALARAEDDRKTSPPESANTGATGKTGPTTAGATAKPTTVTKQELKAEPSSAKKTTGSQPEVAKSGETATTSAPAGFEPKATAETGRKPAPDTKAATGVEVVEPPTKKAAAPSLKADPAVASADNGSGQSTEPPAPETTAAGDEVDKGDPSKADQANPSDKPEVEKRKEEAAPALAATDPASTGKQTSTARFRRTPTDNKIKGTMVAEFPKRLVIKYEGESFRDPFETLINETRTHDNPIEQRVPNVEGLRLVGILESNGDSNRALFEDNDGYGYILKSGDKVRNGYVLRVESDRVYFQIFEYGWSRTVALMIEQ